MLTGSGFFLGRGVGAVDPSFAGDNFNEQDWWSFQAQAGDRVSIAVDGRGSGVDPYVELYNAAGGNITSDGASGPDGDAFISGFVVPSTATYYVRVGKEFNSVVRDNYYLRVEIARGLGLEFDPGYANDTMGGANGLNLVQSGNAQLARVAGTVMAPEGANFDEDLYALGLLNAGNVIELSVAVATNGTVVPLVTVINDNGDV